MIKTIPLNIANKIFTDLLHHKILKRDRSLYRYLVFGQLQLKGSTASCTFLLDDNCLENPPKVYCHEPWLVKNIHWHTYSDSSLCYVFDDEWRDVMNSILDKYGAIAMSHTAYQWILRDCQWLLNKHLLAHQLGTIDNWQKAWNDWPHNHEKALEEYVKKHETWYKK